jgi:CDI immunity proteins
MAPTYFDRSKTLEELEGVELSEQVWPTPLVKEVHRLRTVPLEKFSTENLRIMIGQQCGLLYLVPMALDVLDLDPWAAGDLYKGDLLHSVLRVESDFWTHHLDLVYRLLGIFSELGAQQKLMKTELLPQWTRIHREFFNSDPP